MKKFHFGGPTNAAFYLASEADAAIAQAWRDGCIESRAEMELQRQAHEDEMAEQAREAAIAQAYRDGVNAGNGDMSVVVRRWKGQIEVMAKEAEENARIIAASGEREAALMAKVERLERELFEIRSVASLISHTETISDPDAVIKVEVVHLTDEGKAMLTSKLAALPAPSAPPQQPKDAA